MTISRPGLCIALAAAGLYCVGSDSQLVMLRQISGVGGVGIGKRDLPCFLPLFIHAGCSPAADDGAPGHAAGIISSEAD